MQYAELEHCHASDRALDSVDAQ
eukprot:SAG31_NODE_24552_length_479_cov_0.673684_2_plen_22_part_01